MGWRDNFFWLTGCTGRTVSNHPPGRSVLNGAGKSVLLVIEALYLWLGAAASFPELCFANVFGEATSALMPHLAKGKHFDHVELIVRRAGGRTSWDIEGNLQLYWQATIGNR